MHELAVGSAVECDPACQSQGAKAGPLCEVPAHVEEHPLKTLLECGGHVLVNGCDRVRGLPLREQIFVEIRPCCRIELPLLSR